MGWRLTIPPEITDRELERLKKRWRAEVPRGLHRMIVLSDPPGYQPMSTPTLSGITAWVACPRCGWEHYALIITQWRNTVTRECQECRQRFYQADE